MSTADDQEIFHLLQRIDAAAQLDVTARQADEQLPADIHKALVKYRFRAQQASRTIPLAFHIDRMQPDQIEAVQAALKSDVEKLLRIMRPTLGDAPPTEPGWYWVEVEGRKRSCVEVFAVEVQPGEQGLYVADFDNREDDLLESGLFDGARWSGRIPEPTS